MQDSLILFTEFGRVGELLAKSLEDMLTYCTQDTIAILKIVMAQLNSWFNDYNNNHPHKGLRLKSPREFIREVSKAL